MHRLFILIRRLAGNDKGAVAIIFGLMLIPLILAIGVGVDYARAVAFKAQLQAATDDWRSPAPRPMSAPTAPARPSAPPPPPIT